jgi:predicted nucleic acid-binding protein
MSCLLDTSVLARLANKDDVDYAWAVLAVEELHRRGDRLTVSPQNYVEFWNVATRPRSANGLGLASSDARRLIDGFRDRFTLLVETPEVFQSLLELLTQIEVIGKQVHDARLVTTCRVNQIDKLMTFNVRHFFRFTAIEPGLAVIDPRTISPTRPTNQPGEG